MKFRFVIIQRACKVLKMLKMTCKIMSPIIWETIENIYLWWRHERYDLKLWRRVWVLRYFLQFSDWQV